MPDRFTPAKTYIASQIRILNKLKGKPFYRKSTLVARAQMMLSAEDRALSKQVLADYKKSFKKTPAEKDMEKDVFKFREVINKKCIFIDSFYLMGLFNITNKMCDRKRQVCSAS